MIHNDHRPGFDRLIKFVLGCVIGGLLFIFIMMMGSCNPAAKQQRKYDKACKEAEALVAKAVYICPGILEAKVTHDTVTVYTKAEARAGERLYNQYSMDSLMVLCANKKGVTDTVEIVRILRQYICKFDTIRETTDKHALLIWPKPQGVGWWVNDFPQRVDTVIIKAESSVSTTPDVPKTEGRVRSVFWVAAACSLTFLILGFCIGRFFRFMQGAHRYDDNTLER